MAIYRLRSDVRLERDAAGAAVSGAANASAAGSWRVVDPALGRAIRLGDTDARIVRALAQGGTVASLVKATRLPEAEIISRMRGLAQLYLLQGKRSQARLALQAERDAFARQCQQPAADEPIEWPQGRNPPRHACVGTGTCCGATFLGPLTAHDQRRVASLQFGSRVRDGHVVRLGHGTSQPADEIFETVALGGVDHHGMARGDDERCVAQGDDLLCDVHREHGSAAKPVACRLFPLRFHRTPRGVHVSLLLACDGYDRAREAAGAWPAREAEVRNLMGEGAAPVRATLPLEWSAGVPVPQQAWWTLRAQLLADEPAQPDGHLWLAHVLHRAAEPVSAREAELAESRELLLPSRLTLLAMALQHPGLLGTPDALADHVRVIEARAADLGHRGHRHDAGRLADLAAGLRGWHAGIALQPRGAWTADAQARQHLHDVVANDLPAHVAIGQLDAGLELLTRRLLLVESLACIYAQRAGRTVVTGRDTTAALHVAYRSEPDLMAMGRIAALAPQQRP